MLVLDTPIVAAPVTRWRLTTKIAFRFCATYFTAYVLFTQMLQGLVNVPVISIPQLGVMRPPTTIVQWVATHVFRVTRPLVITGSGSGDKTFDWVQAFCLLILATALTAGWSYIDRRRDVYVRVHAWFRVFLRFALGSTLVTYGSVKAIPLQMPYPPLTRLLEPFGNFSPMGVLWYSIGASRAYETFTGCAELTAGILLLMPQTATLGALVSLAVTIQIFTLNMTYDVPVKLFSFHLILMSLFLLAPDVKRLLNVLVLNRPAPSSRVPPIARTARGMRIAVAAQIVFGLYVVANNLDGARDRWHESGGGAPKSPLYGVWNVEHMAIDGTTRAPLITDYERWRRVIFDVPTRASFQRMDDTFAGYGSTIDMSARSLALTKQGDSNWKASFSFEQPAPDRLTLDGQIDGHRIQMRLQRFDPGKFLLVSRGFNWVQEYPFNR